MITQTKELDIGLAEALDGFSVQPVNFSDQIRDVLRKAILNRKLQPGDKLPSEDKLALHFNVSKTAVREALGQLVADGLIEKRRGAMGGSFVANGDPNRILNVVVDCFQMGGLSFKEIVEFRQLLEPSVAAHACESRTDQDLKAMKKNLEETRRLMEKGKPNRDKQVYFHHLVAVACHNRLISASVDAAIKISNDMSDNLEFTRQVIEIDLEYNEKIYECIKEREKERAYHIMSEHFDLTKVGLGLE